MGKEFELKYSATPEILRRLAADGDYETITMRTQYYDTPDGALAARKMTLRTRLENGVCVCTVKTPAGPNSRGEWDVVCHRIEDAIPELCKLGAPEGLMKWTRCGLMPVCGARFTRLARKIELPDCVVELALDEGVLLGGGKEDPLCEVEVELKSGSEEAAAAYARTIAACCGLKPQEKSKFRRALDLAKEG